jgi:hypothetical protein
MSACSLPQPKWAGLAAKPYFERGGIDQYFATTRHHRNRPRAKKVPSQLGTDLKSSDIESTLRSIRRYIERAKELMLAAAKG